ncbi:response regulator receiver domain [Flavobacterium salmonis]|nr:response regulator receiver domain [Flavobacterium salmonis]
MDEQKTPIETTLEIHQPIQEKKSFEDVAKEIIKDSIRNAICIDDNYLAPYSDFVEGVNSNDPKKLYYSFRKEGHCDLDIYQFKNFDEWRQNDYMIHNKDLLILDWELDDSAEKYKNTLLILNDIISKKNIPFVVIYTNTEDLNSVSQVLCENYNFYNSTNFDDFISLFKDKISRLSKRYDEVEIFFEENKQLFFEFFKFFNKREEISNEIIKRLAEFLELTDLKKLSNKIIRTTKEQFSANEDIIESMLIIANLIFSINLKDDSKKISNKRIGIDKDCFLINGVIILVLHKSGNNDGVEPENLFNVFSEAIYTNPHSIINLITLELKDKLREDFSSIGTKFNMIDERAFLYHANNYVKINGKDKVFEKSSFVNFVIQSWMNELTQYNLDLDLRSTFLLEELLKEIKVDVDLPDKLSQFANMVSCVNIENRKNKKITFGDIFKSGENYFLCITPLCDCLNTNKIENQFYFTVGTEVSNKSSLEKAEQGFYSFINCNSKNIAIEWKCKPFTSYIPTDENNIDSLKILYANNMHELEHLTILKENYTQRIANNSFGYGYRVGVDLPHIS